MDLRCSGYYTSDELLVLLGGQGYLQVKMGHIYLVPRSLCQRSKHTGLTSTGTSHFKVALIGQGGETPERAEESSRQVGDEVVRAKLTCSSLAYT